MKRHVAVSAVAVLGVLLAVLLVPGAKGSLAGTVLADPPRNEPGVITVTGDADVRVIPDQVVLTLGIETSDAQLAKAKEENDAIAAALLELSEQYEIPARHVQTDFVSIEPVHEDQYSLRMRVAGYRVLKTVVITLSDITQFESLLSDALLAGANHVQGIEFRTTELRKYRDEARALAIRAAREKAEALTGELYLTIGDPQNISEQYSSWWSSYSSWWGSRWGGSASQNVIQEAGSSEYTPEGTLAPGQITVNARVSVTFEIAR